MANKHLKKQDTAPQDQPEASEEPKKPRHVKEPAAEKPPKKAKAPKREKKAKTAKKAPADETAAPAGSAGQAEDIETVDAVSAIEAELAKKEHVPAHAAPALVPEEGDASAKPKEKNAAPAHAAPETGKKRVVFRRDKTPRDRMSHKDAVGAVIALIAAVVLLAATAVIWVYRDRFSPDEIILSADSMAVPDDEYIFDAGSGQAFAAAGNGLAVANAAGLELLDGTGVPVTSMLMQMENPTAAGCADYAVFYDLGGTRLAVARFDGTVEELPVPGAILSVTVSPNGYMALTSESTGYRAMVTVYDPTMRVVYEWYSSSAWVISACMSPDGRQLAVLSYTASGSEVRFFDLQETEQQAVFAVEDTVLLDVHWFSSSQLCALSAEQAFFFGADGEWKNTYSFDGQYLVSYTFDENNCVAFALSPYRAGTTATLVALDPAGSELGKTEVDSEIVCLTASDLEIMVLGSDGAILYTSSLAEKGRLTGLPGFKYGLLRGRGEALLIAANYAEVYTF